MVLWTLVQSAVSIALRLEFLSLIVLAGRERGRPANPQNRIEPATTSRFSSLDPKNLDIEGMNRRSKRERRTIFFLFLREP